jgi:hypothetical protein
MHGTVLESSRLPNGADLKRTFLTAMLRWLDDGWRVGEFSSASASFFCDRNPERRMVSIEPTDPHEMPMDGGTHRGGCASCGE